MMIPLPSGVYGDTYIEFPQIRSISKNYYRHKIDIENPKQTYYVKYPKSPLGIKLFNESDIHSLFILRGFCTLKEEDKMAYLLRSPVAMNLIFDFLENIEYMCRKESYTVSILDPNPSEETDISVVWTPVSQMTKSKLVIPIINL